jgi:transcription antitermination protein NusB
MAARSKARKRALDVLFEAEVRGTPVLNLLAERITIGDPPVSEYAAELVRGVVANQERIDSLIAGHAEGWTLDRMPAVDRNVLRVGIYELLGSAEIPDAVAISEAVALAEDLSTDASPAFVNGILARLAALKPTLTETDPADPADIVPDPSAPVPDPAPAAPDSAATSAPAAATSDSAAATSAPAASDSVD